MQTNNLYIDSNNEVASKAIKGFLKQCTAPYEDINNEIFSLLSWLPLEKLYISITSSDSIFYRFKLKDSCFEFMWEAFLNYDGEGNKGSTLQIYKNTVKQKATFGDIYYIYGVVNDFAFKDEQNTEADFEPFETYEFSSQICDAA